jgi:uncharacterized protein (TIGR02246 family)
MTSSFDQREVRAAEEDLARALESEDRTAWVEHYTEDALFVGPGAPPVQGREALLAMARSMAALSSVSIVPVRTEMAAEVAAVYIRGSWISGGGTGERTRSFIRGILVWRKDHDGRWRVAQELLQQDPSGSTDVSPA